MAVFTGGIMGTLLRLRCPNCRETQARARKPGGGSAKYRCRKCHKCFRRVDGEAEAKAHPR